MPVINLPQIEGSENIEDLRNMVAKLIKELNFSLNKLDWKNINHLLIRFGNGGFIRLDNNGIVINDGVQDTFVADVNGDVSLLGTIYALAGKIAGWTIENNSLTSSTTSYPRVVIDPDNKEMTFYGDADSYIKIGAFSNDNQRPYLEFVEGNKNVTIDLSSTAFWLEGAIDAMFNFNRVDIDANLIYLWAAQRVYVPNFGRFYDDLTGRSLAQELDNKADRGLTGGVVVGDGAGGTKTLLFDNGVFVGVI